MKDLEPIAVSVAVDLILQLAWQETIASQFGEVEPEHLLEATLKFAEMPVEKTQQLTQDRGLAQELEDEIDTVRKELAARSIDSRQVRRAVRCKLGKGSVRKSGGPPHRSHASRMLFTAAARLAERRSEDVLRAKHLLEAILAEPTTVMKEALGGSTAPQVLMRAETPCLKRVGKVLGNSSRKADWG